MVVTENDRMIRLTIRCQPRVPVAVDELEQWLEHRVTDLRANAPQGIVRLSRLTQGLPNCDVDIGWLVELQLPDGAPLLDRDLLLESLRDMRLLGLQPSLLAPLDPSSLPSGRVTAAAGAFPGDLLTVRR